MADENLGELQNNGYFHEDTPHGDYSGKVGTVPHPDGKHDLVYRKGDLSIAGSQKVIGHQGTETVTLQKTTEFKHQINAKTQLPPPFVNTPTEISNISNIEDYRREPVAERRGESQDAAGDL